MIRHVTSHVTHTIFSTTTPKSIFTDLFLTIFDSAGTVIDHNQYVYGKYAYQSNYGAGISVLDVSSIPSDPTGRGVKEVASFDVYPNDDEFEGGGTVAFVGTWSSFAGYPSGFILINTIERGAWVVKVQKALP